MTSATSKICVVYNKIIVFLICPLCIFRLLSQNTNLLSLTNCEACFSLLLALAFKDQHYDFIINAYRSEALTYIDRSVLLNIELHSPYTYCVTQGLAGLSESGFFKVENILKGSLDSTPSPLPSVRIQIMGGKVCLRCRGKTLLGVVNKLLKTKSC